MLGTIENFKNDTAEALGGGTKHRKRDSVFSNGTDEPSHLATTNYNIKF